MKQVAYTIVTENYLPYAWALRRSFMKYHPDFSFIICLVATSLPQTADENGIILVNEIPDERIAGMQERYNDTELCCALKPYFGAFLFNKFKDCERLVYLDSDIHFFGCLKPLPPQVSIIITPHRTRHTGYMPGMDNYSVLEMNRYGVFNGGYFECRNDSNALNFFQWWQTVLENHGYNQPDKNQFLDQLWMDVIPAFFDAVLIEKSEGYNVAFWNLIERKITTAGDNFFVNENAPLVFYHFSHYTYSDPGNMVRFKNQYLTFARFPEAKVLYNIYRESLTANRFEEFNNRQTLHKKSKTKKWFWQ